MVATSAGPCDSPAVSQRSMWRILPRPSAAREPGQDPGREPDGDPGPEAHRRAVGDRAAQPDPAKGQQGHGCQAADEEPGEQAHGDVARPEPAEQPPDDGGEPNVTAAHAAAGQHREQQVDRPHDDRADERGHPAAVAGCERGHGEQPDEPPRGGHDETDRQAVHVEVDPDQAHRQPGEEQVGRQCRPAAQVADRPRRQRREGGRGEARPPVAARRVVCPVLDDAVAAGRELASGHVPHQPHGEGRGEHDPGRGHACPRAARPAAAIASTGAGTPVKRRNCSAAWCTSMSSPETTVMPAAAPARASGVGHPAYTTSSSTPEWADGTVAAATSPADPGRVETTTSSPVVIHGPSAATEPLRMPTPRSSAQARRSAARLVSRARTVSVVTPSSARASTAERAVAPAPSTRARSVPSARCGDRARTRPTTSVLVASQPPSSRRTRVLVAAARLATSETVLATSAAASLSGMVSDSPRHWGPRAPTNAASPAASTSWASYSH